MKSLSLKPMTITFSLTELNIDDYRKILNFYDDGLCPNEKNVEIKSDRALVQYCEV